MTDEILVDMAGLEFIKIVVGTDPMVHCAAVSSLSPETFHDASEGLGILMQMPPRPEKSQMENLLQQVNRIFKKRI